MGGEVGKGSSGSESLERPWFWKTEVRVEVEVVGTSERGVGRSGIV